MAQELIAGKRFVNKHSDVIRYDESFRNSPFRISRYNNIDDSVPMVDEWNAFGQNIWTEVKPCNVHQDLIDSYKEGQAWQYKGATKNTSFWSDSIDDAGDWCEPSWLSSVQYRLHPYNDLIQAHRNGAKIQAYICGEWVEEPNPDWYEDTEYRIKPSTKIVYEWMYKPKSSNNWFIAYMLMDEKLAKVELVKYEYRKTGRAWEVEE
jgi:hypothetical protein